jgi:hypothetical protein
MPRAVYKYPLQVVDEVAVSLPEGAEVLDVQAQAETPCLWALVDPTAATEQRFFRLFGTGHPVAEDDLTYVGTFQLRGGVFVYHVFEKAA